MLFIDDANFKKASLNNIFYIFFLGNTNQLSKSPKEIPEALELLRIHDQQKMILQITMQLLMPPLVLTLTF